MRKLIFGLLLALSMEGAAIACSCIGPHGEKQKREFARDMARSVVAIAEIEALDYRADEPKRYRVLRTFVGGAPKSFFDDSNFEMGDDGVRMHMISSCDASPARGERGIVALYPPHRAGDTGYPLSDRETKRRIDAARKARHLEVGSSCNLMFLRLPGVLEMVKEEARKLGRTVSPR